MGLDRDENRVIVETENGKILGNREGNCLEFLGVPYASAGRFEYPEPSGKWEGILDATEMGAACPQYRQWFAHLDVPERLFYHREFREGLDIRYDEDTCLNLNIYAPENGRNCPVIVYIHGGGFNSGANCEEPFRGNRLADRGVVSVFINYRVGVLGYLTNAEIREKTGFDGNFGLHDQITAIKWVKKNIADFGGDPDNITVMGQSAGAISIQYMCLDRRNSGLFSRAVMLSGAGLFPKFALPRTAEKTHEYWDAFLDSAGCGSLDGLKALDIRDLFGKLEDFRSGRKDNVYNTMPVVDGRLLEKPVDEMMGDPMDIDYMIGFTSCDMYAPLMAKIGMDYAKKTGAYAYYFDIDAPGDSNGAFHSSDLRYMFGRLGTSWRPYTKEDETVAETMMDYLANFAKSGDPNGDGLPRWESVGKHGGKPLRFRRDKISAAGPNYLKLAYNMISKGEPKA